MAERARNERDEARFTMGPAILFCPGDRPERFAKAAERADAVILDLEDAVAPADKAAAREAIAACDLDPARTIVRVNPVGTDDFAADIAVLRGTAFSTIMLAKTESESDVRALARALDSVDGLGVVALVETARGVVHAQEIAEAEAVVALMWGAEDLMASMGGSSSRRPDGSYRDIPRQARATVALAAGAHHVAMIDAIHVDIADVDGLRAEAEDASACGFAATACIHPGQVAVIREAYAPTSEESEWARRVLAAAEAGGVGVFSFEGRMVDEPVLAHARTVLSRTPLSPLSTPVTQTLTEEQS